MTPPSHALIVDDEPDIRELLELHEIEKLDYHQMPNNLLINFVYCSKTLVPIFMLNFVPPNSM